MKSKFVILSVVISSLFAFSHASAQAQKMKFMADENGTTDISVLYIVAYGAKDKWSVKTLNSKYTCNNATFGDPIPGTVKSCLVADLSSIKDAAAENGSIKLPAGNSFAVVYGVDKRWAGKSYAAGTPVSCSNATFGDPAPGTVKSCKFVAIN